MSKFPDFYGFWEFPNYQNSVPNDDSKSQELGKFPTSSNTDVIVPVMLKITQETKLVLDDLDFG